MKDVFHQLSGQAGNKDRSYQWYMTAVRKLASGINSPVNARRSDLGELKNSLEVSSGLYMFLYDAKHKDRLPYWDRFPLCIPVENTKGGFYGINLHYLPPMLRADLFAKLLNISKDGKFTSTSWGVIQKFPGIKACIKRYRIDGVKSQFLKINPDHWKPAIFLPLADFQGADNAKVWRDSRELL